MKQSFSEERRTGWLRNADHRTDWIEHILSACGEEVRVQFRLREARHFRPCCWRRASRTFDWNEKPIRYLSLHRYDLETQRLESLAFWCSINRHRYRKYWNRKLFRRPHQDATWHDSQMRLSESEQTDRSSFWFTGWLLPNLDGPVDLHLPTHFQGRMPEKRRDNAMHFSMYILVCSGKTVPKKYFVLETSNESIVTDTRRVQRCERIWIYCLNSIGFFVLVSQSWTLDADPPEVRLDRCNSTLKCKVHVCRHASCLLDTLEIPNRIVCSSLLTRSCSEALVPLDFRTKIPFFFTPCLKLQNEISSRSLPNWRTSNYPVQSVIDIDQLMMVRRRKRRIAFIKRLIH